MQTQNHDSAEEQHSSQRKIKFSQQIPSLHPQISLPSFDILAPPVSILKRRRYSFTQYDLEEPHQKILQHSNSQSKFPPPPRKFHFKIESSPRIEQVSFQDKSWEEPIYIIQQATQSQSQHEVVQIQQNRGPKKLPVWVVLVGGMLIFVLIGWFLSRMLFIKIKANSKHNEEEIFTKYLKDLTEYQVKNIRMYRPIKLRKNTWIWNMTRGEKDSQILRNKDQNGVKFNQTLVPKTNLILKTKHLQNLNY